MIPKVIHYCWFGKGPMPDLALRCIESWKQKLPDYVLKEWNESNFDLDLYPYVREAYDNRKFAFVTDVVRLYALYTEGGVYMDTDVEVLKSLDPYLHHVAFSGYENSTMVPTGIMASEKGGKWVKDNLDYYEGKHFVRANGSLDLTTNVTAIMRYMIPLGLRQDNTFQDFPGLITIYPKDFFCPKSQDDGKIYITDNTVTIHHYAASWESKTHRVLRKIILLIGGPKLKKIATYFRRRIKKRDLNLK